MTTIRTRVTKLEEQMVTEAPETRRLIQIYASIDMGEGEVEPWLLDRGIDVFKDDLIIFRSIIGIEPGTMERVYSGAGTIEIYDPATNDRQHMTFGEAA